MIRTVALLLLFSSDIAVACVSDSLELASDDVMAPEIVLMIRDVPLAQPFSLQVLVCDDVEIEDLRLDARMLLHQHGMNYSPTVERAGDGVFVVNGMLFHMPGLWQLRVHVDVDGEVIRYTQSITLQ